MNWKYKTHFGKSCSRENDFSYKVRCQRTNDNEFPACVTVALLESKKHLFLTSFTVVKKTLRDHRNFKLKKKKNPSEHNDMCDFYVGLF